MSLFFVDSGCDFSAEQLKKMSVEVLNLPYSINDKKFNIDEDFDLVKFYSKVRKDIVLTSDMLSEKEYIKIFDPILGGGDDIIYVVGSSSIFDLSNLLSAKDKLLKTHADRRFEVIDSKNFSAGQGVLSFLLAMQYHNGATIDEILEYAAKVTNEIATYMVVESLEPLIERGLIDSNLVSGTALNIKPIVAVDFDGNFRVVDKIGGKKRAISKVVDIIRQTGENVVDYPIMITNAHACADAQFLAEKIKSAFGEDIKLFEGKMLPTNTSIVGLGAVVLSFHINKKMY
jgi:DegV family protein with EDD domain